MAKQIPCAAFGYVVLKNEFDENEILNDELFVNNVCNILSPAANSDGLFINKTNLKSGYTWLYTSGKVEITNVYNGQSHMRLPGYCNVDTPESVGMFMHNILEPSTVFCLGPVINSSRTPLVPKTQVFRLKSGETTTLVTGTKLFLASGNMTIDDNQLSGPRQVWVKTSDKTVTADADCYGLIFP